MALQPLLTGIGSSGRKALAVSPQHGIIACVSLGRMTPANWYEWKSNPSERDTMSNVKRVDIMGEIPFNTNEHPDVVNFLGQLNAPCCGLRISYVGQGPMRPNSHGGQTAFYRFSIDGEEAVSVNWIEALLKAFVACGASIAHVKVRDIENNAKLRVAIPTIEESIKPDTDWVFERSCGHDGMRNTKTGDWLYLDQYHERRVFGQI
jgi:hypothetical protein